MEPPLSAISGLTGRAVGGRKLIAIAHVDMVGYSRLIGLDDTGTIARLQTLRRLLIDPAVDEHGGRIVQTAGDSLLIVFDSIDGAVRCAVKVQRLVPGYDDGAPPARRIRFRIGINIGDVIAAGTDLHGDGVNVAVRLQTECPEGGVCVSQAVRDHVHDRLNLAFEELGSLTLKNISRPVRAFVTREREIGQSMAPVAMSHEVMIRPAEVAADVEPPGPYPSLPDTPSIVVLPFQNMSGDPEQEYFADGMVEDITTGLSRIRSLFVIARNSAFTYKGRAVDVRQIGRELGVRYVLEGSVRKAASRVRITGQLIDAATGAHLWADRFDGSLADVFDLQDQMTASVVGAIEPNLRAAEIERARRKPTENLQAYDLMLRAWPHYYTFTREGLAEAIHLLRRAIEIDPAYAPAMAFLALTQFDMVSQHGLDRSNPAVADMIRLAQAALTLDSNDPNVLRWAGFVIALASGDLTGGIALVEKAIVLNPNNAGAIRQLGHLYAYAGNKQSAIDHLDRAFRLDPVKQIVGLAIGYATAYFVAGEYDAVIEWVGKALLENPNYAAALRFRAASLGLLGRLEEGRETVRRLLDLVPDFTIARARRNTALKSAGVADSFCEGLRRTGVPE
jgi:TolB-like protein/class 3 adenylate cyclase